MNNTPRSALMQLCSLISSPETQILKLSPYEIAVLFVICRYLDMPLGKCFAKQTVLAQEACMSERQFRRATQKLVDLKLLTRGMRGKLYHYYLGEYFELRLSEFEHRPNGPISEKKKH